MAKKKGGFNKSAEIRRMFKENPKLTAKEVVEAMTAKGHPVTETLVYINKGKVLGRKRRKKRAQEFVARVAETTGKADALSTILKIKHLAAEVGGLKKLKALVDALSE